MFRNVAKSFISQWDIPKSRMRLFVLLCGTGVTLFCSSLPAVVLPNARLTSIFPPGARQGTTVDVAVSGVDLDDPETLTFSYPGISAVRKMAPARPFDSSPQPLPRQFTITVAPEVPPGIYEVRTLGPNGLSAPRSFVVSDLPELRCDTRNTTTATAMKVDLGTIVNCPQASGDSPFYYEIQGKPGEPILIWCTAHGFDSLAVPVLELLDARGITIAFGRATNYRDARICYSPQKEERLILKVADATYRSGTDFSYRLEISQRPWIDSIWPPIGQAGSTGQYTIYGHHLPGGVPATGFPAELKLEELGVSITLPEASRPYSQTAASPFRSLHEGGMDGFEYRLRGKYLSSNPVFLAAAAAPVVVEQDSNNTAVHAQQLALPCDIAGRFFPAAQGHWFSFMAVKGETYAVDVFSERLNAPTDAFIAVWQGNPEASGTLVQEQDDPPRRHDNAPFDPVTHDPTLQFTAQVDGMHFIQVRDLYAGKNSHPRNHYRLILQKQHEDFRLLVTVKELGESSSLQNPQRALTPLLRKGGTQPLLVQVNRIDGFAGPITLTVEGLPQGVSCTPVVVPASQNQATIILSASPDAPVWHGTFQVFGTAQTTGGERRRAGVGATITWDKNAFVEMASTRTTADLALAVIDEIAPLRIIPEDQKVLETCHGFKLPVTAKFEKHIETTGNLTLELRGLPFVEYPLNKIPSQSIAATASEGIVEVQIAPALSAGDYPCYLNAQTRASYSRHPERAKQAEAKKTEFEALISQLTHASAEAALLQESTSRKLKELNENPVGPTMAEAIAATATAQMEAEAAASKAREVLAAAQAELPNLVKQATDLANAAKPQEIDLYAASEPVVIRVHDVPFRWELSHENALTVGASLNIPVQIERLFGFQDSITIEAILPAGISGLTIEPLALAAMQNQGNLVIKTTPETPAGPCEIQLIAKATANGHALQSVQTMTLQIDVAK